MASWIFGNFIQASTAIAFPPPNPRVPVGSGGFGELGLERHSHLKTSKILQEFRGNTPFELEKALFHLKPHKIFLIFRWNQLARTVYDNFREKLKVPQVPFPSK